jgi:DNA-binding NtrC family response regulator
VLLRLGYKVVTFASGKAATEYVENHKVDAVLIDMVMDDGWDGLKTYEALARAQPGIRSILVSGFAETDQVLNAQQLGAGPFQRKPFTIESLGQKLVDILKS